MGLKLPFIKINLRASLKNADLICNTKLIYQKKKKEKKKKLNKMHMEVPKMHVPKMHDQNT